jgi:hypothetical protein
MFGASLATSTRAAESSAAPSSHHLDVRAFGAKGDGTTDDTAAFQTALNQAYQTGGGIVFVPPGRYLIATHLSVPHNVTLEGIFTAPPTTPWRSDSPEGTAQLAGSVLLAIEGAGKADGTPFIQLHPNATLKGIAVFSASTTRRASSSCAAAGRTPPTKAVAMRRSLAVVRTSAIAPCTWWRCRATAAPVL